MGAIGTAATGGGALLPWLHLRSEGKWLRWLRLNPPKLAPFLAAPNNHRAFVPARPRFVVRVQLH
jgi:hypothetical protein